MGQLNFNHNYFLYEGDKTACNLNTLSFVPLLVQDSISLNTFNVLASLQGGYTFSVGLYSITGSTLSIANSMTATISDDLFSNNYISFSATSTTQNITPGTWYFGILLGSTASTNSISMVGGSLGNAENAFPGAFIGGAMTVSTNALPASYATSDLDITGSDALFSPFILLNA